MMQVTKVVKNGEARVVDLLGPRIEPLTSSEEGSYCVMKGTLPAGVSVPLHSHGDAETDVKVQQELLRHSDIRTTMNIYTHTVSPALREANSRVVRMVLPERKTA